MEKIKAPLVPGEEKEVNETLEKLGAKLEGINLEQAELLAVKRLLCEFSDVCTVDPDNPARTDLVKFFIETDPKMLPISRSPYRRHKKIQEEINKIVRKLLAQGQINRSTSPWASPVVIVPKKDGGLRFCVDYTWLNKATKKMHYPLPRMDDVLESFQGATYFSALDLKETYWSIRMTDEDKEKTAFITQDGLYEWNVMPFGLANAPAYWSKLMDAVFGGMKYQCLVYFIDDILIFSNSYDEHLRDIARVFQRLRNANLRVKLSKCSFFTKEVKFLGWMVTADGLSTDPKKIEAVNKFEVRSKKSLQSFLGLTGFYRKFVKNYAKIIHPLLIFLKKGNDFKKTWDENPDLYQGAIDKLKHALTHAPVLKHPDFNKKFKLQVDAFPGGLGAVCVQEHGGKEHVIAYASRTTTAAERKWPITHLEALAIV